MKTGAALATHRIHGRQRELQGQIARIETVGENCRMTKKDQLTKLLRRSLQFKLRSLLLILAILCVWLGWYSVRVQQQREAVDWVLKNGGTVRYDYEYQGQKFIPDSQPPVPECLLGIFGADYFSAVTWVEFNNNSKQLSDVLLLGGLTKVEHLDLSYTQVSDLAPLASLANLKELRLSCTQVVDVAPLTNLTNLEKLWICNTQVNDLTPLKGLIDLKILLLENTQVNDVIPLAGLTNLDVLMIADTQISDLAPLAGLANLTCLTLHDTQVSDVAPLAGLTNLRSLILHNTQVNDVAPLAGLANLKEVWLANTQVSGEDIEKLKQALPNCSVDSVSDWL